MRFNIYYYISFMFIDADDADDADANADVGVDFLDWCSFDIGLYRKLLM